jgi:hypothetical protein
MMIIGAAMNPIMGAVGTASIPDITIRVTLAIVMVSVMGASAIERLMRLVGNIKLTTAGAGTFGRGSEHGPGTVMTNGPKAAK